MRKEKEQRKRSEWKRARIKIAKEFITELIELLCRYPLPVKRWKTPHALCDFGHEIINSSIYILKSRKKTLKLCRYCYEKLHYPLIIDRLIYQLLYFSKTMVYEMGVQDYELSQVLETSLGLTSLWINNTINDLEEKYALESRPER